MRSASIAVLEWGDGLPEIATTCIAAFSLSNGGIAEWGINFLTQHNRETLVFTTRPSLE